VITVRVVMYSIIDLYWSQIDYIYVVQGLKLPGYAWG